MTRSEKIRKGNQLFNELQKNWSYRALKEVSALFSSAEYQDGLFRLADYLAYEKKMPLLALSYYKKINNQKASARIAEMKQRMVSALQFLIQQPK